MLRLDFDPKYLFSSWRAGIGNVWPRDTVFLSLSRDMLNHELPSLSPVSIIHQNEKRIWVWKHLLHCVVHWSIERSTSNGPKEPFWTLRRRQSKAHLKSGVSSFSYRPVYCSNGCSKHYRDGFLPTSFPRLNPLCDWLVAISSSFIRCCLEAVLNVIKP